MANTPSLSARVLTTQPMEQSFQINGPMAGLAQIFDTSLTFDTLLGNVLTMPFQPKMIQDEMGEAFEQEYGRMSGNLGVESPNPQAGNQNMILYGLHAHRQR